MGNGDPTFPLDIFNRAFQAVVFQCTDQLILISIPCIKLPH